jgi:hypothetical protein
MVSPFQNVGRCVYCDSTKSPLTREHVLPRGLGGNSAPNMAAEAMVLAAASCLQCAKVTRKFEGDCLNDMMGPARARLKLNRKDRANPKRAAKLIYRDGREEEVDVDNDYLPAAMLTPSFPTAAVFAGLEWSPGATAIAQTVFSDETRLRNPDVHQVQVVLRCNVVSFARMLSKIALGVAHYTFGPNAFRPVGREFILTGQGHPNHYVGGFLGLDGSPVSPIDAFHYIALWHHGPFLVATIQLFAAANTPINYVVIGELNRMPPGLPLLQLGSPIQHQNKIPARPLVENPTTAIQWDQVFP